MLPEPIIFKDNWRCLAVHSVHQDLHSVAPGKAWERRRSDVADGNLSSESRGFDPLPAEANHRPEASLACACGNARLEA
jgi:hypothetical protein